MLGLKLNHVSKRGHRSGLERWFNEECSRAANSWIWTSLFRHFRSILCLTGFSAPELPVHLYNFEAMWYFTLPISQLRDLKPYGKTSRRISRRGPVSYRFIQAVRMKPGHQVWYSSWDGGLVNDQQMTCFPTLICLSIQGECHRWKRSLYRWEAEEPDVR